MKGNSHIRTLYGLMGWNLQLCECMYHQFGFDPDLLYQAT